MKYLTARTCITKGVVIPGGYLIPCPHVSIDDISREVLIEEYTARVNESEAPGLIIASMQDFFEFAWRFRWREFITYWAEVYLKQWPEMLEKDGGLRGFDPERMLPYWLSGERNFQRAPVNSVLFEMYNDYFDVEIEGENVNSDE